MTRTRVRPTTDRTGSRARFACTECRAPAPRWVGRCAACGSWGSVAEVAPAATASARPEPIAAIDPAGGECQPTGLEELDRLLGGGLVPGSATLIGGEPGMGKSTLVLQALGAIAASGERALLVGGEESREQVARRAHRLGTLDADLLVVAETSLPAVLTHVADVAPRVVAVDSIQTLVDPDVAGAAGSINQVRECAQQLVRVAKDRGFSVVLVSHVTKEGALAGPRALEHVVDTVLSFEGDRHHALRMLRAVKHRFGSTAGLAVFEMGEAGLAAVRDPSALFLADRHPGLPGSVVVPVLEGTRPLLVEVQALVTPTTAPMARRSAQGFDSSRLGVLLAVLHARAHHAVQGADVFVSVAGGVRVDDAGADLATVLALASSARGGAIAPDVVALGEVGLGGEVRQAGHAPRRLAEAARLGFRRAIVPPSTPDVAGLELVRVAHVLDALDVVGLAPVTALEPRAHRARTRIR